MKEALLWKPEEGKARCGLCSHSCLIPEGKRGLCGVRQTQDGKLQSLTYGRVIAMHPDPIEKKPLYHFLPGTSSMSIATEGCNFSCKFCQNADISQGPRETGNIRGREVGPEDVVESAKEEGCKSIAYTYTEPTVFFEFAQDTGLLAKKEGLFNVFVTNGFMTKECLKMAKPWLDAANVDLKAFTDEFYRELCGARLEPVLENLKWLVKNKIWTEVTTLLIPGKNDSNEELKQISEFIAQELGKEVPWHVSAFHPCYRMTGGQPTPPERLLRAYEVGKDAGLDYIYIGNMDIGKGSDTQCPECGEELIKRRAFSVYSNNITNNKCPKCGHGISGVYDECEKN